VEREEEEECVAGVLAPGRLLGGPGIWLEDLGCRRRGNVMPVALRWAWSKTSCMKLSTMLRMESNEVAVVVNREEEEPVAPPLELMLPVIASGARPSDSWWRAVSYT